VSKGTWRREPGVLSLITEVLDRYLKDGKPDDFDYDLLEMMCAAKGMTVEDMLKIQDFIWGDDEL
jgi:hypothetical protein